MLGKLAKIAKCQKSNGYNFAIVEMAAEARVTVAYKLDDSDELFHASLDEKATVANLLEKIRNEKARPDLRKCLVGDCWLDGSELLVSWKDTTLLLAKHVESEFERIFSARIACTRWEQAWPLGLANKVPEHESLVVSDKVEHFRMDRELKSVRRVVFGEKSCCVTFLARAFECFNHLNQVLIPDRVEIIGERCFYNCSALEIVYVSRESQITEIGKQAFANSGIFMFQIPPKVQTLPVDVFDGCHHLGEVRGNEHLKVVMNCVLDKYNTFVAYFPKFGDEIFVPPCAVVKSKAFAGVHSYVKQMSLIILGIAGMEPRAFSQTSVKRLHVTAGIDEICDFAFEASAIKCIEFAPDSFVRRFGKGAFTGVKSITVPSTVEEIGEDCFGSELVEIKFKTESKLRVIGRHAFQGSGISTLWLPPSVEELCDECFVMCMSLSRVEIANDSKLKRIGVGAFCLTAITYFTVPANVEFIGRCAFRGCSSLRSLQFENPEAKIELGVQILNATPLAQSEEEIFAKVKQ